MSLDLGPGEKLFGPFGCGSSHERSAGAKEDGGWFELLEAGECDGLDEQRGPDGEGETGLNLSFASANRDAEVFPDPFRLDVRRANASSHLAFGFGRHFCLGAHLARMEIRAIFKELLARVERLELAGEPRWTHAYFVEGPKSIPIAYRMR